MGNLNAQTTEEQTTKFRDNWSIGFNGGIVSPLTHSAFFKNARAVVGLNLNKQFSPVYGLTIENNWTVNTQSRMTTRKSGLAFDAFDLMALSRVNLNNMFAGYDGKPRVFEVEAVGGFGWLRLNRFWNTGEGANHLASKVGANFNFNVGEERAWTVAIKPAVLWDMSMWDAHKVHRHPNFNANYANWEITAGITYHFKNSNGKHYYSNSCNHASEIAALNATISTLEAEAASKDRVLEDAQKTIGDLQKALDDCNKKKAPVATQVVEKSEYVVNFRQGSSKVDALQMPNIDKLATYLKNNDKAKVSITGYASPEGGANFNQKLSEKRAEVVKNILVKEYGINADRIEAQGKGVGSIFGKPTYNRVSICVTE